MSSPSPPIRGRPAATASSRSGPTSDSVRPCCPNPSSPPPTLRTARSSTPRARSWRSSTRPCGTPPRRSLTSSRTSPIASSSPRTERPLSCPDIHVRYDFIRSARLSEHPAPLLAWMAPCRSGVSAVPFFVAGDTALSGAQIGGRGSAHPAQPVLGDAAAGLLLLRARGPSRSSPRVGGAGGVYGSGASVGTLEHDGVGICQKRAQQQAGGDDRGDHVGGDVAGVGEGRRAQLG